MTKALDEVVRRTEDTETVKRDGIEHDRDEHGRSEQGGGPAESGRSSRRARKGASLLERYQRTREVGLRNQLVERYRGIVSNMARSLSLRLPRSVDVGDLEHAGMWGLIQAIEGYEVERNAHFLAFMRLRVRGAMLDELRNMDHLPRLFRRRVRRREEVRVRLRQDLGREPGEAELAEALGVSLSELRRNYGHARLRRLGDDADGEGGLDAVEAIADDGVESPIEAINRQELLEKVRDSLQPIEWKVLRMHYLEGMSGKEVARRLRLSASRICQIHGRVMQRLKHRLVEG